jgi:hypothetical protein
LGKKDNKKVLNSKPKQYQNLNDKNSKQYSKGDKSKIKNLSPKFIGDQRAK